MTAFFKTQLLIFDLFPLIMAEKKKKRDGLTKRIVKKVEKAVLKTVTTFSGNVRMRGLPNQKQMLHDFDWDNLIVLDTCRYDYFEQEYRNYLGGDLTKVRSPASWTYTWLRKVFEGKHDFTVYSSHPGINSKGIGRRENYIATNHFKKIVDIWDWGWDDNLATVPPWAVNDAVLKDLDLGEYTGRNIIWYMQPHSPWIGKTRLTGGSCGWDDKKELQEVRRKLKDGEIDINLVHLAYRDNLRLVLEHVGKLAKKLPGKTIVTSDHGELLGEWNTFRHPPHLVTPQLREVPWLEIKE